MKIGGLIEAITADGLVLPAPVSPSMKIGGLIEASASAQLSPPSAAVSVDEDRRPH